MKTRKDYLINSGVHLASRYGLDSLSKEKVSRHAKVSAGLINHYFGNMREFKNELIKHALMRYLSNGVCLKAVYRVLAQGILQSNPLVYGLHETQKVDVFKKAIG